MDPCIVKIKIDLRIGSESKVSVDAGLERLKVMCSWDDGQRERVPVSKSHRDKRIGKCVSSVSIQFNDCKINNIIDKNKINTI